MAVTAQLVKTLRERTGAGMMECKRALVEANGDLDRAVEQMRKAGLAKADKKAGRVAAEGVIALRIAADGRSAALVEVNSETDFVANSDKFRGFADDVAGAALAARPADVDALLAVELEGATVDERRRALVAALGENIHVRRFGLLESRGTLGHYLHGTRIGVLVAIEGGDGALARDLAMQVAAGRPVWIAADDVPREVLDKEREILRAQAHAEGKPPAIVEKMVEGRLRKVLADITLLGQLFVKDDNVLVGQLVAQRGARVNGFLRFEVGEGIEKKEENFAAEVIKQVRGA
ncbi:MAG TPA: translation elongation factor Ts [Gammaproteobacteria bacterium]|nr:translation elongation factor Ts [Gammaproteobacteria bacterium]